MDREMKFLFASLDRNGDFRLYHICSSTAYDALVNLILQVERPSLEMATDAIWYWNYTGCSTCVSVKGSWNDLCAYVRC